MNPDSKSRSSWQPPSVAELQALLPGYEFHSLLGRGGMGAVFKATQRSLNRPVAIKMLPTKLMEDADANFAARFRQEALTMAKLTHPGIVSVFESGEAGGLLYIVMEFVDGTDVARMIASEGRLAPELATKLLTQVCDALHYAHEHGVVHRDIKPANLLVTRDGTVKIADFGLAKHDDATLQGLTKTNVAIGTPDFLAPEAWTPNTTLDGRADVYALGVTLYQMLTGEVPRGFWEMPSARVGTDKRFDAIIERALQPKPEARYQSSAELRRALEKIQAGPEEAGPARAASVGGDSVIPSAKARRRAGVVSALLLAILAGAGLIHWWNGLEAPPQRYVLEFENDTNQFVSVANFGAILPTNEITVEFWAEDDRPADWIPLAARMDGSEDLRITVGVSPGLTAWKFGAALPFGLNDAPAAPNALSNWTHYAVTASRSANEMRIFVNGEPYARKSRVAPWTQRPAELRMSGVGWANTRGNEPEEGRATQRRLAEVRLWDVARSPAEIKADFRRSLTGNETNLLLYYPLNESSGTIAANLARATGHAYDGRLVNRPTWVKTTAPGTLAPAIVAPLPRNRVVTKLEDSSSPGSLRYVIEWAAPYDTITFTPELAGGTIELVHSRILIDKPLTIDASALPGGVRIDGKRLGRIFEVAHRIPVTLKSLTLTNGSADRGGAVYGKNAFLRMLDCTISGNQALLYGGGIYCLQTPVVLSNCIFANNEALNGGGAWLSYGGAGEFAHCTFTANRARSSGGALMITDAQADVANCRFIANSAATNGGGIWTVNSGLTLVDSVVVSNTAPTDSDLGFNASEFNGTYTNGIPTNPLK